MSEFQVSANAAPKCQAAKADGASCSRTVAMGQKYCWQHAHGLGAKFRALTRSQTVVFVLAVLSILVSLLSWISPRLWELRSSAQKVTIEQSPQYKLKIESCIVARLWSPAVKAPPVGHRQTNKFAYKELFYEWVLTLTPERTVPGGSITVSYLSRSDLITLQPLDAVISEAKEGWVLGFKEEKRGPDYYSRVFSFTNISKNRPLSIKIRRPITELIERGFRLSEPNVIRVSDISCPTCVLASDGCDPIKEAERLNREAAMLAQWKTEGPNKPPLPLRSDSGVLLGPGEIQASVELRVQDAPPRTHN